MRVIDFILGPQLPGAVFFLIGLVMYQFPPKRINKWYGYRTDSSMKNQQTWDEANGYSARLMALAGLSTLLGGIAITVAFDYLIKAERTRAGLLLGLTTILGTIPVVIVISKTESHLDKTFNKKDEIR